jgi:hypothetical protein
MTTAPAAARAPGAHALRPAAFFDGIGTAHSLPLVAGLDRAAASAGMTRQWTSALRPPGVPASGCDWTPTRAFYTDYCERGDFSPYAYRRAVRAALARAEASGAAFFCDLAVEQLLASRGAPVHARIPSVWVVHQVPHPPRDASLVDRAKTVVANPRKWPVEARLRHARAVLRDLARTGGRFVVHTEGARNRLARIVPGAPIHVASWPTVLAADPPQPAPGRPDLVAVVFPGEARQGKGLDVLLEALEDLDGIDIVDLPTVMTDGARELVQRVADPRVRMGKTWLTNDEYQRHLRAATLAVLPYRTAAMANAGISASLLDVLAVGLPAVITKPIARGLPEGYGGAIVVEPDSPPALARGIYQAIRALDRLRTAARAQGPAFVAKHHSYERYLEALVAAGTS